jgi:hypothetical protein
MEVKGDFNDSFMVRVNWDGTVFLYSESDEGYTFMRSFTNVTHLMKDMPGFAIISPTNSNERYLPSFIPHTVTKTIKHHEE